MHSGIEKFQLEVPEAVLVDLQARLARTRWPERQTVESSEQGVPLSDAQLLCAYWRDVYDRRRCEAQLNALGQFRSTIDGLGIHFLHVRSPEANAVPLILTHGWPGSVIEFVKVIGPPSDPAAHGGDWGSAVTTAMAVTRPPELAAIHLNMVIAHPQPEDQASGILEKLTEWSDCGGNPLSVFSYDQILDNIMLYWLPGTAASSGRLYWESNGKFAADPIDLPVACSVFPKEIIRPARGWALRKYPNLIYWGEPKKGGHFATFEQPELFVSEMRNAFASIRNQGGTSLC